MKQLFLAAALALLPAAASAECRMVRNEYSFMRAECSSLKAKPYQPPAAAKRTEEQRHQQLLRDLNAELRQQNQQLFGTSFHRISRPGSRSTGF